MRHQACYQYARSQGHSRRTSLRRAIECAFGEIHTPRLAKRLRYFADRIDRPGAPKRTQWSFEFVRHVGIEFNNEGHGCPLWYLNDADYERAYERKRV